MSSYFDKRKKQKLYQQWVEKSGLSPESVPGADEGKSDLDEPAQDYTTGRPGWLSNINLRLTMRHVLYLLLIIAALLVAASSLVTVLIMRSCA